jgi:hypothetical protein
MSRVPFAALVAALVAASILLTGVLAGCSSTVAGVGAAQAPCPPVFFGVPGSGQGLLNPPPKSLPAGVSQADADRYGTTIAGLKSELVRISGKRLGAAAAVRYPAIPVDRYLGPLGLSPDLDTSESKGVTALVDAVRARSTGRCADRPVLLAGYSQGAEVVTRAVDRLTAPERARVTVALLGNPSYRPDAVGDFPARSDGSGIRPTFLNGQAFALPAAVRSRTIDVCAPGDPVCGVDPAKTNFFTRIKWVLDHVDIHGTAYAYGPEGYARIAARFLWQHRAD